MTRAARYGVYGVALVAVLLAAAALLVPRLLDRPRMAAEIQAKLSNAIGGEVRWKEFSVRILPAPHGVLRGLEVETEAATLTAEEVDAALALWPLFRGRAEITSLTLGRPVLSLTVVPAASVPVEAQLAPAPDPLQVYRSTLKTVAGALESFAPDTRVAIRDGAVRVHVEGMPPIEASSLALAARTDSDGVQLEASAASPRWNAMKLAGRIRYADLSSTAELHLARVDGQPWLDWALAPHGVRVALPEVDLTARFKGDASKGLELDLSGTAKALTVTRGTQRFPASPVALEAKITVDAAQVGVRVGQLAAGATRIAGGELGYAFASRALSGDVGYRLDLEQALGYARELAPEALARIDGAGGELRGRLGFTLAGDARRFGITAADSDATLRLKDLPGPLRLTAAVVETDLKVVTAEHVALSLPGADVRVQKSRYALKGGAASGEAKFDLDMAQALALLRAALPAEKLEIVESASGRMSGSAKGEVSAKTWTAAAEIARSDAQVRLKGLPAVAIGGASVRATPKGLNVERAAVRVLDATIDASATVADFSAPRIRASGEATLGPESLEWAWQAGKLPAAFALRSPVQATVRQVAWSSTSLDLQAAARFGSGPVVTVDLAWSPDALDLRRTTIHDARSDVAVSLSRKAGVLEGKYAGRLDSRTIGAMLKSAAAPAGAISGELAFTFDPAHPERIAARGALQGKGVDLSWLAGKPAMLERMELSAGEDELRVAEATVDWAGQRATLRGTAKRGGDRPVIDAQIESPGVQVEELISKGSGTREEKPAAQVWPLPVSGRIAVRSAFVQYEGYKVAPFSALVTLEPEKARLEVKEAFLCGLAVPLTAEATPKRYAARTAIAAQKQKLEETVQCLAGEKLLLTGPMDLRVDVRTEGELAELVQNLTGTVSADVRDGTVTRFALLGNILSMQNVVALAKEGGPKLGADAFPFRQLSAKGRFEKGRLVLEEGVFHSNAVGLGANGWVSLSDFQTNLTVLVAPLALVDEAVRKLPLLGYVVGGTFTSLPVAVTGDIRDPRVVPLGPRAITNEMMGLLTRTLSLPGKVVPGGK